MFLSEATNDCKTIVLNNAHYKGAVMLDKIDAGIRQDNFFKKSYVRLILLLCISFIYQPLSLDGSIQSNKQQTYYLNIADFAQSFIQIPTSNVSGGSSTIDSSYLAGRAAIYDMNNTKVGTCSASFLCMQNADGIYTDISNYISVNNGLVVSWFTPTTLINLELDSIINSMVTECMVVASTKIGVNPYYGQTFNLIVSSDNQKIYFAFTRTGTVF